MDGPSIWSVTEHTHTHAHTHAQKRQVFRGLWKAPSLLITPAEGVWVMVVLIFTFSVRRHFLSSKSKFPTVTDAFVPKKKQAMNKKKKKKNGKTLLRTNVHVTRWIKHVSNFCIATYMRYGLCYSVVSVRDAETQSNGKKIGAWIKRKATWTIYDLRSTIY